MLCHADVRHVIDQLDWCLQLFAAVQTSFVVACSSMLSHADVQHIIETAGLLLKAAACRS